MTNKLHRKYPPCDISPLAIPSFLSLPKEHSKTSSTYQFSQTAGGITVRIIFQCPIALLVCHVRRLAVSPSFKITCSFSFASNASGAISYLGCKNPWRALLPRKSASTGCRKVNGVLAFLQNTTMLVKSPSAGSAGGSSSRNTLQDGKTDFIVLTTRPADGSARSPA